MTKCIRKWPSLSQNVQVYPKMTKSIPKMSKCIPKWPSIFQNDQIYPKMTKSISKLLSVSQNDQVYPKMTMSIQNPYFFWFMQNKYSWFIRKRPQISENIFNWILPVRPGGWGVRRAKIQLYFNFLILEHS